MVLSFLGCFCVMLLERLFPWRPEQEQFRPELWSDLIHLVFNAHFLGLLLAGLASTWILSTVDKRLGERSRNKSPLSATPRAI